MDKQLNLLNIQVRSLCDATAIVVRFMRSVLSSTRLRPRRIRVLRTTSGAGFSLREWGLRGTGPSRKSAACLRSTATVRGRRFSSIDGQRRSHRGCRDAAARCSRVSFPGQSFVARLRSSGVMSQATSSAGCPSTTRRRLPGAAFGIIRLPEEPPGMEAIGPLDVTEGQIFGHYASVRCLSCLGTAASSIGSDAS